MRERFKGNYKVLEIARKYIGTVEKPVNRTIFGEWFGWNGVAWCAIFVSFVYWFAGVKIPPIQKDKGSAYVPSFVEWAKATGQWRPKSSGYKPKPTDLVIFWFTTRPDHIATVEAYLADGRVMTIEGNTNATGSRTGGMVARLFRRSGIHGYICVDSEVQNGVDLVALRKWLAAVTLGKLQGVRTRVPTDNNWDVDVKTVQEALNIGKNAKLVVDGQYGPATTMQMADWQNQCRKLGLPISDPVGVMGDTSKWWLCVHLRNITEGRA